MTRDLLPLDADRLNMLRRGFVEPVVGRCIQCGLCSYNCPAGIDVRSYSRQSLVVSDPRCMQCGSCVARCPRGAIRLTLAEVAA